LRQDAASGMLRHPRMIWFWFGFFALVALLLFLDLFVFHKDSHQMSFKEAIGWTIGWMSLGLAFGGVVFLMYHHHWLGAEMHDEKGKAVGGVAAASAYWAGYLLEQALSIDNIFVISLVFTQFRVKPAYQHRILFWGIMGAVVFRVAMLAGGVWLAQTFSWIFYIFGGYLAWQGIKLLRSGDEESDEAGAENSRAVRILRRMVRIVDGDHGGKLMIRDINGKRALTTLAVCLVVVELTDIVFALDSIPAVLSVTDESFIVITSNIFAILGLRSLYFVLAGAMAQFHYLKLSLAVLLMVIGAKMIAHSWIHVPHWMSLLLIAGILAVGVIASSVIKRPPEEPPPGENDHGPIETIGEVGGEPGAPEGR
jgi:tellurite resistance protein TerC